jgi:outer membrane receptor for ferrienterochelin and colicins
MMKPGVRRPCRRPDVHEPRAPAWPPHSRCFAIVLLLACSALAQKPADDELQKLSLEELMNVHVVSASNISERLSEAPATVIVITRRDIKDRGYSDLSEIFDDLPGMDVVRTYGDTYFKNYWRGYRNTIGEPFLVMIDGVIFNHLYFNTADVFATFPLTNVDRVEVVYGPASSVYGANAFMGVVNVITHNDALENGTYTDVQLGAGSSQARLVDATVMFKSGDVRLRMTTRIDDGNLDDSHTDSYEYTKNRYFADRRLWGGFVDNSSIAGSFLSPRHNRALDVRAWAGELEAGAQYFRLNAGYGVEYAGDRAQNNAVWSRPDVSAYLRYHHRMDDRITSTSFVRYRTSGVSNDSDFVNSTPGTDANPQQTADFSFWSSTNSSVTVSQDFDVKFSESLALRTGARYEQKDLQKAYDITYGPALPPSAIDGSKYPYPQPPSSTPQAPNHLTTEDTGVYVQTWWRKSERHRFNFGVRNDHDSRYGGATTVRMGYVGTRGPWGVKALFGQAFQEPNNRLLYGGWDGSGSDPKLRPERSSTTEVSGSYTRPSFESNLSVYRVMNYNTFVNTVHTAQNLGDRQVVGADYVAQWLLPSRRGRDLKAWASVSHIFRASEKKLDANGIEIGDGPVGDLALNKLHFGLTSSGPRWTATLRGRWMDERRTVTTNPVGTVSAFTTIDGLLRVDDVLVRGVSLSLRCTNLMDRAYFHPGIRDANAGTAPGFFDARGRWIGSGGYFNSLLPQPGRQFLLSIEINSTKK